MKFFANRAVALVIALLVVCSSTVWSINRGLKKEAAQSEALWSEPNGLAAQLEYRASTAVQLCSVLNGYGELSAECGALREAANAYYAAQSRSELCAANLSLTETSAALMAAGEKNGTISEKDRENAAYYYDLVQNAGRVIDQSGYNAEVTDFYRQFGDFPLRLLKGVVYVELPEYFQCA